MGGAIATAIFIYSLLSGKFSLMPLAFIVLFFFDFISGDDDENKDEFKKPRTGRK